MAVSLKAPELRQFLRGWSDDPYLLAWELLLATKARIGEISFTKIAFTLSVYRHSQEAEMQDVAATLSRLYQWTLTMSSFQSGAAAWNAPGGSNRCVLTVV